MRVGALSSVALAFAAGCHSGATNSDAGGDGGSSDAGLGCPTCTVFVNGIVFDGVDAGLGAVVIQGGQVIAVVPGQPAVGQGTSST